VREGGRSSQCSLLGVTEKLGQRSVRELIYAARCIMGSHCYANHSSLFTVLRILTYFVLMALIPDYVRINQNRMKPRQKGVERRHC
jgi:hypothetical protein